MPEADADGFARRRKTENGPCTRAENLLHPVPSAGGKSSEAPIKLQKSLQLCDLATRGAVAKTRTGDPELTAKNLESTKVGFERQLEPRPYHFLAPGRLTSVVTR